MVPGTPTGKSSTAASFSGAANLNGLTTAANSEYGLDPSYRGPGFSGNVCDQSTPNQVVGSDVSLHAVSASVSNLVPSALYHVRLVAPKAPAPPPPVLGETESFTPIGLVFVLKNGRSSG